MSKIPAQFPEFLPSALRRLIPYYILILAVAIFYSNVYDNAFLYDDKYLIIQNDYLHSWSSLGDILTTYVNSGAQRAGHFYRPLQNVLYLITYQIAGESTFAFHLLNVALHATNACLILLLSCKLNFNKSFSFFAALLWTLHPIHTEAITYVSATADTLFTLFSLWGIIYVLPDFSRQKMLMACVFYIFALLSKEAAIIFPLLVMSCIYLCEPDRLNIKTYFKTWPIWCVTLGYLILRFIYLPFSGKDLLNGDAMSQAYATQFDLHIYTFLATVPAYLKLLFWPVSLHFDHDFPVRLDPWFAEIWLGLALIFVAFATMYFTRNKNKPALGWGFLWFGTAHVPQSGVFISVNSIFLEHWMYLPTIGLFLAVGQSLSVVVNATGRRLLTCASVVVAFVLGISTYNQNAVWHDPITFYKNIIDHGQISTRARNNLGTIYVEQGHLALAKEQFDLALKKDDTIPETHQNLAAYYAKLPNSSEHIQDMIDELNKAIAMDPNFVEGYEGLANLYDYLGDKEKVEEYRHKRNNVLKAIIPQ